MSIMENDIVKKLVDKSVEAFILGIEIYNKPTIRYRIEGFSFFICNAWELMLKAYMIKKFGYQSIYYKDNPGRTISLENCIKKFLRMIKIHYVKTLKKLLSLEIQVPILSLKNMKWSIYRYFNLVY